LSPPGGDAKWGGEGGGEGGGGGGDGGGGDVASIQALTEKIVRPAAGYGHPVLGGQGQAGSVSKRIESLVRAWSKSTVWLSKGFVMVKNDHLLLPCSIRFSAYTPEFEEDRGNVMDSPESMSTMTCRKSAMHPRRCFIKSWPGFRRSTCIVCDLLQQHSTSHNAFTFSFRKKIEAEPGMICLISKASVVEHIQR
jgi:hypothetical protein